MAVDQIVDLFFTEKAENDQYAQQVRSSAGLAVFVTPTLVTFWLAVLDAAPLVACASEKRQNVARL